MDIKIISIPTRSKANNSVLVKHVAVPTYDKAANAMKISSLNMPLEPKTVVSVGIIDNIGNIIPASINIIGAILFDSLGFFDPIPINFNTGSLVANETNFVFGFGQYTIAFDIQYQIVSGRTITEHFTL